jgi:hypothetical protein
MGCCCALVRGTIERFCSCCCPDPEPAEPPPEPAALPQIDLPHELHIRIIDSVYDVSTLLSLCLVSKAFYTEAIRGLYYDVYLPTDMTVLSKWFQKVTQAPQLGRCVVYLSLAFQDAEVPLLESEAWLEATGKGIKCLTNLKESDLSFCACSILTTY